MKKEYTYCILSVLILVLGIIFTISGILLQTLPDSSKSALLIFSIAFIIIGIVSFAVHHKNYKKISALANHHVPVIARWTFAPDSSDTLKKLIKEEKHNALATAILVLILAIIFSIVFAYSGSSYVLFLGYTFAILCFFIFIIATRFISAYYNCLMQSNITVIFGEDYIYFIDEIYSLNRTFHLLENVNIYIGHENLLIFEYGFDDIDNSCAYSLTIPIPSDKLNIAIHLKDYYRSLIKVDYE